MKNSTVTEVRNQRGAVLVVSLIMLAVMTLFVISMLKTSIIELKIGGASQVAALNFSNAEFAINNFISANNGRYAPGFLPTAINIAPTVYGGTVTVTPTELHCGVLQGYNAAQVGAYTAVQFDLRAVARDSFGGETTLVQGVQSIAPGGAC